MCMKAVVGEGGHWCELGDHMTIFYDQNEVLIRLQSMPTFTVISPVSSTPLQSFSSTVSLQIS